MRLSTRSYVVALGGLGLVAFVRTLIALGVGGPDGAVVISDIGSFAIVALCAGAVLLSTRRLRPGERLRTTWTLVGAGVLSFALGDLAWTVIEVGLGREAPYPGLPDLFYLAEYFFLAWALLRLVSGFRGLVDLKGPTAIASAAAAVGLGLLWFGLLQPYVFSDPTISAAERALSAFYPIADIVLLGLPTLVALLVVLRMGSGSLAWPWYAVAAGVLLLAMSDATFSWMSAVQGYEGGAVVDYGWMAAHVMIAFGASLSVDAAQPKRRPVARVLDEKTA
ncbi:MAG: hypothetical protein Q8K99_08235 [Actinomycetota bacterium]|nr:hypothetical protein [Actinomycetota bacterium]